MPSVKQEIEAVANVLPNPKVLWGAEATEDRLLEYGATSTFIHIASHGYFRPDSPMFSAIRLADSYLTLYDLYRMNLPAEFLTLSGCVTGLNVVDEGDELIGLTRGLLYSGTQSLLLSLWDVDDKSTSEFMKIFYEGSSPALPNADVLRSAVLQVRERYPHPYQWAAFKLTGKAFS
jgi:CHAT domain-containing protein